jgi:hypothetical protein
MAPSNLNQVFVANAATTPALVTGAFSQVAASGSAANSKVGVYTAAGTTVGYATALMSSAGVLNSTIKTLQFTQTMLSGNCIATPLIDTKNIKRIAVSKYKATTRAAFTWTPDTNDLAVTTTTDDNIMIRIALRLPPMSYESFANPNNGGLDLSGGGYAFPLVGNFAAGRMIFNIEVAVTDYTSSNYTAAAGATAANQKSNISEIVKNAVVNNKILNAIFEPTLTGSSGTYTAVVLTARHAGVEFDVTISYSTLKTGLTASSFSETNAAAGVGNYWQAISDEKRSRSRYGNFNRMYFPFAFPEFTVAGGTYDVIDVSYAHDWPASTGIARAGELNNVRIYVPTLVAASTNVDTAFGLSATELDAAAGTVTEYLF